MGTIASRDRIFSPEPGASLPVTDSQADGSLGRTTREDLRRWGGALSFSSMSSLLNEDFSVYDPGDKFNLNNFYNGYGYGGGRFILDPNRPKEDHDGGNVIDYDHTKVPGTPEWYSPDNIGTGCLLRPEQNEFNVLKFGAVCNEINSFPAEDSQFVFNFIWQYLRELSVGLDYTIKVPPGNYYLSQPWEIKKFNQDGDSRNSNHIIAYGANINHTFICRSSNVCLWGLTIRNSPTHGFQFMLGQGGTVSACLAKDCDGNGFLLGRNDATDENGQVTRQTFVGCGARTNVNNGWSIDTRQGTNSYVNANTFTGCFAVGNGEYGFKGYKGTGNINYNTFVGTNIEGNGFGFDISESRQTTLIGGHYVDPNPSGNSVDLGSFSVAFGGRAPYGIQADNYIFNGNDGLLADLDINNLDLNSLNIDGNVNIDLLNQSDYVNKNSWSTANVTYLQPSDLITDHEFKIDLKTAIHNEAILSLQFKFNVAGSYNYSNGFDEYSSLVLAGYVSRNDNSVNTYFIDFKEQTNTNILNLNVSITSGIISIRFDTPDKRDFRKNLFEYFVID